MFECLEVHGWSDLLLMLSSAWRGQSCTLLLNSEWHRKSPVDFFCKTAERWLDVLLHFLQSDPDLPPDHGSPSPTDEVFDPAPAPPPYMPPQPSIEEARQQMHSLLDDAFALVSPSSQGSAGVSSALPSPSPQSWPPNQQWGSYPAAPPHSPFSAVSVWTCRWSRYFCQELVLWFISLLSLLPAEICRAGDVPHLSPGPPAEVSIRIQKTWSSLSTRSEPELILCVFLQAGAELRRVCVYWRSAAGVHLLQQGAVWGPTLLL